MDCPLEKALGIELTWCVVCHIHLTPTHTFTNLFSGTCIINILSIIHLIIVVRSCRYITLFNFYINVTHILRKWPIVPCYINSYYCIFFFRHVKHPAKPAHNLYRINYMPSLSSVSDIGSLLSEIEPLSGTTNIRFPNPISPAYSSTYAAGKLHSSRKAGFTT